MTAHYLPPLKIGRTAEDEILSIDEMSRRLHMHVMGATGTGKTKFLEHCIQQDILNGQGVCVLDPTGNLYNNLVRWCETNYIQDTRDVVLIDPTEDDWVFGFNPLAFGGGEGTFDGDQLAFGTAATRAAIQRAWGESKTVATPLLRRLLNLLIYTLAEHRLTIAEGQLLMQPDPKAPIRAYLTKTLRNTASLHEWDSLATIRPFEYENLFGSVRNRLFEFLLQPRLAAMISQTKSIDFRQAMDTGQVVLVNLSSGGRRVYQDIAKLIGSLIVNSLVLAARGRVDLPEEERRPFFLYIDECQKYLNDDIAEILDELRQFGLHLILAHQNLTQLREDGSERIAASVMSNARTKVVFQCPDPRDADAMARLMFRGSIDMEEPKRRFDKPTPTGTFRRETLQSSSESDVYTESGESYTESTTEQSSLDGSSGVGSRSTGTTRTGGGHSQSSSYSTNETLVPEYAVMPTTAYSLEEQYERRAAQLATLRRRHAFLKLPEHPAEQVTVPNVEEGFANPDRVLRFKQAIYQRHDFIVSRADAEATQAQRLQVLERRALVYQAKPGDVIEGEIVPDDFDPWDNK